jgi:hypothetical protein
MIPEDGTDEQLKGAVYSAIRPAAQQVELWLWYPTKVDSPSVFKTHSHNGVLVVVETKHCEQPYTMTLATFVESMVGGSIRVAPHGTEFLKEPHIR